MQLLNIKQVAEIKGCSIQNIYKMINEKKLCKYYDKNNAGQNVVCINISDLDEDVQAKYYKQIVSTLPCPVEKTKKTFKDMDNFSAEERVQISFWTDIIDDWQIYRNKDGVKSKSEVDNKFIYLMSLEYPDINISIDILYRKWSAIRSGDFEALVDKRGKSRKGISDTPEEVFQTFQGFYLQENKFPVARCIEYTELYLREYAPHMVSLIPSYSTFRRKIEEIPYPVRVLGREGAKAYYDKCSPYIRREYENIESNDFWVADNHTFDVMVAGDDGKPHRIYLTIYLEKVMVP